jgi:hypothetical protein
VGGRVGENKLDGDALHMKIYPDFRPRDLCMCINIQCIRWDYHYYILQKKISRACTCQFIVTDFG